MEDIYSQLDEAFDKLWEECGCKHSKEDKKKEKKAVAVVDMGKTTNVKGNLKRREFNKLPNEKKAEMAKEVIEPSTGK